MIVKCPACEAEYDCTPGKYLCECGVKFRVAADGGVSTGGSDSDRTIPPRTVHNQTVRVRGRDAAFDPDRTVVNMRIRREHGELQVGDVVLGRYELLENLGSGVMGVVFRCRDNVSQVEYALKMVPPELARDADAMEEVRENFQLVYNLNHPNIAGVKFLERDEYGAYFLIMEYARGESLGQWIRRKWRAGRPELAEVANIVKQIAAALDYAHSQKILHRDVKPANVMVDERGVVKVLDFGLAAKVRNTMTALSVNPANTSGTPNYLSPEQFKGKYPTPASDQYALGVLAYQMLAGHLPFESDDPNMLRAIVAAETPDPISGVPDAVNLALQKVLSKDPRERYAKCKDFVAALTGMAATAAPEGPPEPAPDHLPGDEENPLLVRAFLYIEGGDFDSAREYCERVLDAEPRNGNAYFCRLLAELKLRDETGLIKVTGLEENKTFKLARRFAGDRLASKLDGVLQKQKEIREAEAEARRQREEEERKRREAEAEARRQREEEERKRKEAEAEAKRQRKEAERRRKARISEIRNEASSRIDLLQSHFDAEEGLNGNSPWVQTLKDALAAEWTLLAHPDPKDEDVAKIAASTMAILAQAGDLAEKQRRLNKIRVKKTFIVGFIIAFAVLGGILTNAIYGYVRTKRYIASELSYARINRDLFLWSMVLDHVKNVFDKDPDNAEAKALKEEAEEKLQEEEQRKAEEARRAEERRKAEEAEARRAEEARKAEERRLAEEARKAEERRWAEERRLAEERRRAEEARKAEERRRAEERRLLSTGVLYLPGNVKLELVKIEAGSFRMGSPEGEEGRNDDEARHRVTLTKDFYLGKTEVTQAQWKAVMGNNPSCFKGDDRPVEQVSWNDAMAFCKKLNSMGKSPRGWKFTLPTETQWEFAARGGNKSSGYKYAGSNDITEVAWYYENSGDRRLQDSSWSLDELQANNCKTHPVASKKANELGLYDMSGNVWEWCLDWYEKGYAANPETLDGNSGSHRVYRGGSWYSIARGCRSAYRGSHDPGCRFYDLGFRLALVPEKYQTEDRQQFKEAPRRAEDRRKTEEARRAEEARKAEEARRAEERRKAAEEERRKAAEQLIKKMIAKAEQGNAEAQNELGDRYFYGKGTEKNLDAAKAWFRRAAEQGNAEGQKNLGVCYYTEDNYAEAIKWFRKAADQGLFRKGHAGAQYYLGLCYGKGFGVEFDQKQAIKWFRKAADQGDARAQFHLGWCYENGFGVAEDLIQAVEWYRKAAAQGDKDAQEALKLLGTTSRDVMDQYLK